MRNALTPVFLFHISMGAIALLSGAAALVLRKGSHPHRMAGKGFVISMLCMSATGVYLAFVKPALISAVVGVLTIYLVATAWMTVNREAGKTGLFEIAALLVALATAAGGLALGMEAVNSESGHDNVGLPPGIYFFFAGVAAFCAALDLRMIYCGGIAGKHRIARHLWRMCFGLAIAANALFIGNPHLFPEPLRGTLLLASPVIIVFALMIFWLIRVLLAKRYRPVQREIAAVPSEQRSS